MNLCSDQQIDETIMNNMEYQHNISPSFSAKLINSTMGFFGFKKKMEKKMMNSKFAQNPAKLPKSLLKNYNVQLIEQNGKNVWTISPKDSISDVLILYLHGGAYMANISKQHWDIIEQLLIKTKATIIIPDYPLAPNSTYIETYNFICQLYTKLLSDYPTKSIVFIGDSAGSGLALGFAQKLRNENKKLPNEIILFSPWLDVTMTNPYIQNLEKKDKLLTVAGLKSAGQKYAGISDPKDYKISPLYGDFSGMCRISIFIGTNDILYADALKCKQKMKEQNLGYNFFEYPEMFHDWIIFTSLDESKDAIDKVSDILNDK